MSALPRVATLNPIRSIEPIEDASDAGDADQTSVQDDPRQDTGRSNKAAFHLPKNDEAVGRPSKNINQKQESEMARAIDASLIAACNPLSRATEEFQSLNNRLITRWFNGDPKQRTLAIISQGPRDGRSFVAANLAIVFAQHGMRTLLIEADLRSPVLSAWFGTDDSAAPMPILRGGVEHEAIDAVNVLSGLHLLSAKYVPQSAQKSINMSAFDRLLIRAREQFDVVLIDTPAMERFGDAETIAAQAGATLMVVRKNRTLLRDVSDIASRIQDAGVVMVGMVLNHY